MGICPRCKQTFSHNEYDTDYIHTCNSGKDALDLEDDVKIDTANMRTQGMANTAPIIAKIQGEHTTTKNIFGHTEDAYETEQHYEYITLK